MLKATERRERIIEILKGADEPVSASSLAAEFDVSRQIIVGDIALLRAANNDITATPRGYVINTDGADDGREHEFCGTIACRHTSEQLEEELYTIVDFGGTVIDVTIEHALYGQLSGNLNLSSRYDVDQFIRKTNEEKNSLPLSLLTGGIHLHRIGCGSAKQFELIKNSLRAKGILLPE